MGNPARTIGGSSTAPLSVVRSLDEDRWASFVEANPHASVFHTPEMHRVWDATRHHTPELWAATDGDGGVQALFTPVTIATLGGPLRGATTRTVSFAAPLLTSGRDANGLRAVLQAYRAAGARGSLFTEIRHHAVDPEVAGILGAEGFEHERHLNFHIDLTRSDADLWARVRSAARRNVQKASRSGVSVVEVTDPAGIAEGYEVLRLVYRRIQVPLPDRSLFDAAARLLTPLGRFTMLLARSGDRAIGVLTLLRYRGVVTYWYTGTLREDATLRAGDLLAWHAISSQAGAGARVFDFGGAGKPGEPYGVRDFKAKYGGELIDPGRAVWVSSPRRLRAATAGYSLVRRFL
jgi:serine/alanine adding enzyme